MEDILPTGLILPDELILVISAELPTASAYALKHVNKHFHRIVRDRVLFSIDNVLKSAAYYGYLQIIKWIGASRITQPIFVSRADYGKQIMAYACRGGDLETVIWLYANGCPLFRHQLTFAVFSGNINLIEWDEFDRYYDDTYMFVAAALGNIMCLERAHLQGHMSAGIIVESAMYAAIMGRIDALIYLTTVDAKLPECISIIDSVVYNGRLETVRWLISAGHSAQQAYELAIYLKRTSIADMIVEEYPDKVDTSADGILWYKIGPQYDAKHSDFVLNKYALDLSMC